MTGEVVMLGKSERDIAVDLRERVRAKLNEIAPIMDEANRAGLRVEFGFAVDGFGRNIVGRLAIIKEVA